MGLLILMVIGDCLSLDNDAADLLRHCGPPPSLVHLQEARAGPLRGKQEEFGEGMFRVMPSR